MERFKIVTIVPAYNEEKTISNITRELKCLTALNVKTYFLIR